jgi:hypothetical protein
MLPPDKTLQVVGTNKPLPAPPLFPAEQALILPANGQGGTANEVFCNMLFIAGCNF